jgi:phospholipid-translocating ATPase
VCRCSPTQKALIVQKIGYYTKKRTAAVGDGGNDVGMILEANVGIGIVGKEGKQASLASDFSINQFKYLRRLILWHGRLSYKRSAVLSQFVIHRGLIITVIQAIFSIIFYFVAISVYNGYLMLGYSTIYTMFPVFSLVFDEDVNVNSVMKFPPLYKTLQKGRSLSTKTFLIWVWKSIYQGCLIMLATVIFFSESYTNIVTITFSALIIIELLNVYSEVNKPNWKMIVSSVFTFVVYFLSIVLLRSYFDTSYITWMFVVKVIAITILSWFPLHLVKWIIRKLDPSEQDKIMKQERRQI